MIAMGRVLYPIARLGCVSALMVATVGLAACAGPAPVADRNESGRPIASPEAFSPDYRGIETRLLGPDLVSFLVEMGGARGPDDVDAYARCAAAQYAAIRGYGFARHIRTKLAQTGGIWRADAVYTISPTLPRGLRTIDAEVTVADCRDQGIPTV